MCSSDLLHVAKRKTSEADAKFDDRGQRIKEAEEDFGENVLIVEHSSPEVSAPETAATPSRAKSETRK